ncbi:hypothetical protein A3K86_19680 [Photobacterium jeanii]|uniref:DUF4349 domain-containing protein n=1 Tax=Photobacterium jeanii TaxID=858640 RepID=A0A178K381_9GAMM|nr:DUF4349 domain-containing protein [Photobacterium jeanii]OAN11184.1 hypothetical protein A3K86_19680 [Photobacterium jeanii]PST90703.1 DUF4349 domain-containing protein [Photobacterium jeanii]
MKKFSLLMLAASLLVLAGCNGDNQHYQSGAPQVYSQQGESVESETLAYYHSASVELEREQVEPRYLSLLDKCTQDKEFQCTVVSSSLNTDRYVQASVEVRILPTGVNDFLAVASQHGETKNLSTTSEDLGGALVDNEQRLAMLLSYQQELLELKKMSAQDVQSLVQIASELAKVQSDIELAQGERSKLKQRVNMDVVNVSLYSYEPPSFMTPIKDAGEGFVSNLADSIGQAITAIAFLLPWLPIIAIFVYVVRKAWSFARRAKSKE